MERDDGEESTWRLVARPSLILMCGLPFAGKSTLARILARRTGARLISLDGVNDDRGLGRDGAAITPEQWDATYAETYRRVTEALAAGESVVYDETNRERVRRDFVRAMATRAGFPARLIWVTTSEVAARARWLANRQTAERNDVRDEDFADVVTHFEAPAPEEDPLCFDGVSPPEIWLAAAGLIEPGG